MGTRGFIGFVVDGIEKIIYNHFDSYPGGLGIDVLEWLANAELAKTKDQARSLRMVKRGDEPTAADIQRLRRFADTGVSTGQLDEWYVLLRKTQGDPALILEAGVAEDAIEFPKDSLFCEWGYLIDFDVDRLEVYRGFQHSSPSAGAWQGGGPDKNGYYPVTLAASWPLSSLPTSEQFLALEEAEEEDG
jgi:hypothetical protein